MTVPIVVFSDSDFQVIDAGPWPLVSDQFSLEIGDQSSESRKIIERLYANGGIPAEGNVRSEWDNGKRFGFDANPEYR